MVKVVDEDVPGVREDDDEHGVCTTDDKVPLRVEDFTPVSGNMNLSKVITEG